MHHQRPDRDRLQIVGKVRLRKRLDAERVREHAALHLLPPPVAADALLHLGAVAIVAEEGQGEVPEELRAVGSGLPANVVEYVDRHAVGVAVGADHDRRDRADQHRLGDAPGRGPRDITGDLTPPVEWPTWIASLLSSWRRRLAASTVVTMSDSSEIAAINCSIRARYLDHLRVAHRAHRHRSVAARKLRDLSHELPWP